MGHMIPYILPLLLGRTFNLDKMEVGVDIFPKQYVENPEIIQNPVTKTHYKVIDSAVEARNLLDVEGSFSLKVKSGLFKGGASGAYLSDKFNRESVVEVIVKATYQVVTEQLPVNAKPFDLWREQGNALGTHYVRSITYGGELLGSIRMECNNTRNKQQIKAALDVGGNIEGIDVGVEVEGEYMKDVSKMVESTQIKLFSSIPLSIAPNDMKSFNETLEIYAEDLRSYNGGKGVPIKMELWPLSSLDSTMTDKLKNRVLEAELDGFEQKFDDLLNTKSAVANWMKVMKKPLTEEQEKKVGEFYKELQRVIRPFYDVIGNLDMTKGSDQLKPANDAYGLSIPGVFYKKYQILRESIAKDQGEWTMSRGNGATYIHWGKENCSNTGEIMNNGKVVGTTNFGGGANFLCFPDKPNFGNTPTNKDDAAVLEGAYYEFPNGRKLRMTCSTCRLGARGTIHTFVGRNECPSNWNFVYEGVLMSGSNDLFFTEFICLDKNPDGEEEVPESANSPLLPDWAITAKSESDNGKRLLMTCVVCSK